MVNFTDKKLYLKGTCQVNVTDPCDGTVLYSSNKFQTENITTSSSLGEIRGGMGNSIATMIPSDSALNVEFNAADFNLWAKSAQVGATLSYGAPTQTCVSVIADQNGVLTVETDGHGKPVAGLGYPSPFAYVQQTGVPGTTGSTGKPYPITNDGTVTGYKGISGKEYKVTYYTWSVGAQIARIGSMFNSKVLHFTAQMPVFSNENCSGKNEGSRVGWLYVIVPRLKLGGNGGIVGDQTTADTTSLSGQAVAFDDNPMEGCSSCNTGALAYYSYVPDNEAESIAGIAIVGGWMEVIEGNSTQIPVKIVMENGQLVTPGNYNDFVYTVGSLPEGTSVSASGVVTAGNVPGDFEATVTYDNDGTMLTATVVITIVAVEVVGIVCEENRIVVPENSSTQIKTLIIMSNGEEKVPPDYQTGFTYTARNLPSDATISPDGVLTAGITGWNGSVTITYTDGENTFTTAIYVEIEAAIVTGISITENPLIMDAFTTKQIPVVFILSDGATIKPGDYETDFTYTAQGTVPEGVTVGRDGVISAENNTGSFSVLVSYSHESGSIYTAQTDVEVKGIPWQARLRVPAITSEQDIGITMIVNKPVLVVWGDGTREELASTNGAYVNFRHRFSASDTYRDINIYGDYATGNYIVIDFTAIAVGGSIGTYTQFEEIDYNGGFGGNTNYSLATSANSRLTKLKLGDYIGAAGVAVGAGQLRSIEYTRAILIDTHADMAKSLPSLEELKFPNSQYVNFFSAASATISDCPMLKTLDLSKSAPSNLSVRFSIPSSCKILVPSEHLNTYKTKTNWSAYASQFVGV